MRIALVMPVLTVLLASCGDQPSSQAGEPLAASEQATDVVIDIRSVAGKTEEQVLAVLGQPSSCENVSEGKKCLYVLNDIEVIYISGLADWITVDQLDGVPYSADALPFLSLDKVAATFSNEFVMRWSNVPGLMEVSIFPAQGQVDYAYIKTATP